MDFMAEELCDYHSFSIKVSQFLSQSSGYLNHKFMSILLRY